MSKPHLSEFLSTTISKDALYTFISYVHENQEIVDRLCNDLTKSGIKVWSDKNIPPGHRWKNVIRSKIQQGSFFVACFSKEYNERSKTFMNEELNIAVEELRQRSSDQAWFIPVKLSKCDIPDISIGPGETLRDIQWVELYKDWDTGIQNILNEIKPVPPIITSEKDGAKMVLIPAGDFEMGTDKLEIPELVQWSKKWYPSVDSKWFERETPRHTVYVDAFYMDVYEVTNAQYKKFMDATGRKAPAFWDDSRFNAPNQPVVGVSWKDANDYANWAGKRLPTEAEWEKAARGGLVKKRFPWGDEDPDGTQCNFADKNTDYQWSDKNVDDRYQYTAPVGSYPPNGYGLYDMAGNVWEWCADWYDGGYYKNSDRRNPKGPASSGYHVCRGGSWNANPNLIRVASRNNNSPPSVNTNLSFRCVRSVSE